MANHLNQRYKSLIASILAMMFAGSFFLWASVSVYVLSYFHMKNVELGGTDVNERSIYYVDTALIALSAAGYNIGTYLL